MKIALLTNNDALGGGATYLRHLAEGLPKNCECRTFYSDRGECAAKIVNAWHPDVIHVNHLRALLQFFSHWGQAPNAPVVFVVHGIHLRKYDFLPRTFANRIKRRVRLLLERWLYRKCAALVALTESDRAEIKRLYGDDLNVVCIPNGIAGETMQPTTSGFNSDAVKGLQLKVGENREAGEGVSRSFLPPSEFKQDGLKFAFVCIGRFDFPKGQDILLAAIARAAATLREQERRTLFIGGGETLPEMKAFVKAHGIEDLVAFAGEQPNASDWLPCGRLLVAPSRWEGLPFLLLEAGVRSHPVIASGCPGNRDVIEDGVSGVLFPTGDVAALAALLTRPWSDAELAALGSALHVRVASRFALSEMCSRTFSLFASLCSDTPGDRPHFATT